MDRFKAIIQDKLGSYYEAYDEDTQLWGVFGSESGFCYFTYGSEFQAADMAIELNNKNQLYNHAYIDAEKERKRQLAERKLSIWADEAGPLPVSMLAVGGPLPKKTLWTKLTTWLSGSA